MYQNFYLDNKTFNHNNIKNIDDIDLHIQNFTSICKKSFVYGPSKSTFSTIIKSLESSKFISDETIRQLKEILPVYRSFEVTQIAANKTKDQILKELLEIINNNNKIEIALLCNELIKIIFTNKYDEITRTKVFKEIKCNLRSLDNFAYKQFLDIDLENKSFLKNTDIKQFFDQNIKNLINISNRILILDRYCLSSLINKTKDREHGFKYLFDLVRDSDVKNIEIICGFDQNREKNNKKEKVSPLEIVDLFKEEVLNNVFSSYSEDVTKETHAENVFNNLDLTKWRSNNTKENENNDINLIKNKDLKLEIKISIIKHSYFKTRDRFIIFDEHSAVDIHDINSWSTSNGRLNKDTLCSILTPRTKLLEFDRYSKMPELAFIKPIKYYQ